MALSKGIKVQPSRFAALNLDSDSDSDASGNEWFEVVSSSKSTGKPSRGAAATQPKNGPAEDRPLSKSAKKRARKKRNQQSSVSSEPKGDAEEETKRELSGDSENLELRQWQEKEDEMADLRFHKELEEALLQSKLTAEQEKEMERQRKAAAELKKQSKKGIKISLQTLHRADFDSESQVLSPKVVEVKNDDSAFFERVGHEAESETIKRPERRVSESLMSPVEESARVAHVMDELEKRDKTIAALRKENASLMDQMKEVKGRNQQLCKILGKGEFSTKTELLEQMEDLTTVKNELTAEVENLHSLLEQERSRNKTLQAEVTKLSSKTGKNRHN